VVLSLVATQCVPKGPVFDSSILRRWFPRDTALGSSHQLRRRVQIDEVSGELWKVRCMAQRPL
jgi:hypothetical protein